MSSKGESAWVEPTEADVPPEYVFSQKSRALEVASASSESIKSNQTDNFDRTADLDTQWAFISADNLEDDQLLNFYGSEWGHFSSNVTHLNRLFIYLNKRWIKRSGAYPVDKLSNLSWKEHVFQHLVDEGRSSSLIDRVKERLKTYRNGQDVDVPLLENIVDNLMSLRLVKSRDLGVNDSPPYLPPAYRTVESDLGRDVQPATVPSSS
ncbi:hypothetical protein I307_05529 [Cryptococcus deuterogattii 99/473]|uniref:Unplaced genomic scaffold supercont1.15, whole genome shotgun sequence n=1 Tax=Cryptococcus deuterogattii Ram5 TaxID=1296110 RepID=A0A0D0UTG1_9TREE|nr:hypothetical protein I313_05608 [Cryptococcus deuterogattii Ram5]KIY55116.1 hypothetical protein I307_05529 [Cryptococcus deuterogattii 99/473]